MNKRLICLLCSVLMMAGLFAACSVIDIDRNPTARPTLTQNALAGTYWKTAGFNGVETETGDFWSDLFLWEDGTGCFRFSQATPASHYYGMYDATGCDWAQEENGFFALFEPGTKTVLYSGFVAGDSLTILYDGYAKETIKMERAEMPLFGSQWAVPDLYGTWKMVSFSDVTNGYRAVPYYTVGDTDGYFASEMTLDPVGGVHFWLADPLSYRIGIERNMGMGYHDDDTWHPYAKGPIWKGCVNEAWHVELTGNGDPTVRFYVTYADGKLLLRKEDPNDPNSFPSSFTAEFEQVGVPDDGGEGADTVTKRYAEVAYAVILDQYRAAIGNSGDAEEMADQLVLRLEKDAQIEDEAALRELYTSVEEPLRGKSNFGYAIRDINEDGIPELFILSENEYPGEYTINAFYTLRGGRATLVGAYWSRKRCQVGADGTVYIDGSSGADNSFSASYSLRSEAGELLLIEERPGLSDYPDVTAEEAGLVFNALVGKPASGPSKPGGTQANKAETYLFADIVGYDGKAYSIYASPEIPNFMGISGSEKFLPLPEVIGKSMESEGMYVYTFTIYQDKIYYLAAEPGSDTTPGAIYRCNADGSQNELLAYANNFSVCMIADRWLYFSAETDGGSYTVSGFDLTAMSLAEFSDFPENIEQGVCTYDGFSYSFSGSTLYQKNLQTKAESEVTTIQASPMNTYGEGVVIAVVNDTVYYVTSGEYSDNGNTYLFGVSIYGGDGEHLASWFTA